MSSPDYDPEADYREAVRADRPAGLIQRFRSILTYI